MILMVRHASVHLSSSLSVPPFVVIVRNAQRSPLKQLGQSEPNFVEPPWVGGTKVYLRHSGSHDHDGPHAHIW